jgi:hypothetical protein
VHRKEKRFDTPMAKKSLVNLPRNGLIGGGRKIADMNWIWKVFGAVISVGS